MGVAAGEDVGGPIGEEACELVLRRGREQAVAAGARRAVEAEQAARPAELALDRRHEALHVGEVCVGQLRARPLDDRPQAPPLVVSIGGLVAEEPVVGVAAHDRTAERAQPCEHLPRLWSAGGDVAEADDLVRATPIDVSEHGLERDAVAVDVGDEGDAPHAAIRSQKTKPSRSTTSPVLQAIGSAKNGPA